MVHRVSADSCHIPYCHHVGVDLLQFPLGGLKGVRRGVELVGLEALVGQPDSEGFILLLDTKDTYVSRAFLSQPN